MAAAAILDASSSFSSHATVKRGKSDAATMQVAKNKRRKEAQRSHTFSRNQIDSTPKMVTKFDKPYLERCKAIVMKFLARIIGLPLWFGWTYVLFQMHEEGCFFLSLSLISFSALSCICHLMAMSMLQFML